MRPGRGFSRLPARRATDGVVGGHPGAFARAGVAGARGGGHVNLVQPFRRRPAIRWSLELGVIGAAAAAWAGGEYVRLRRSPSPGLEREAQRVLNRVDRRARELFLRPEAAGRANRTSNALGFAAVPLACMLALGCIDGPGRALPRDLLKVLRAVLVTGALNQVIKFVAPRERPFAVGAPWAAGKDRFGSFFSNHTSAMTAMSSATMRLALRHEASAWFAAPLFTLALFVGYLRIAADQHYLTDVLAGAAFGAGCGLLFTS